MKYYGIFFLLSFYVYAPYECLPGSGAWAEVVVLSPDLILHRRPNLSLKLKDESDLECAICLEDLLKEAVLEIRCKKFHRFHKLCLEQSLAIKHECPTCRKSVVLRHSLLLDIKLALIEIFDAMRCRHHYEYEVDADE